MSKAELEKITEQTKNTKGELRPKFISLVEKVQFSVNEYS